MSEVADQKENVLVVCTHNSARSQMAEGWLRARAGDRFNVYSAGVEPGTVNALAVRAMAEVGIDLSNHRAQGIREYLGNVAVHHLIIVCDKAAAQCPSTWPGVRERHFWPFDDPSAATGSDEEKLVVFRRVRDQIRERIEDWLAPIESSAPTSASPITGK